MVAKKKQAYDKPGQPTKYRPEYCQMLIDHMAEGYSYETFAGLIDVCKQTIYSWEIHPQFLDAKKKAFAKCQLHWEKIAINGMISTKEGSINTGIWVFNMKNRFKWTDRVHVVEEEEKPFDLAYDPRNLPKDEC